jgi:hypothetical protein
MAIIMSPLLAALLLIQSSSVLENDFVRVIKNEAPCASASAKCGERIVVALGAISFDGHAMQRGDIRVFKATDSYSKPQGANFLEVAIKPGHPNPTTPPVRITPEKNSILYDGADFFVFQEMLPLGDSRPRHSHSQRVVIVLNETELLQQVDGQPEFVRGVVPDDVRFNEAVVHAVKNVGKQPLRNIVIELKPQK